MKSNVERIKNYPDSVLSRFLRQANGSVKLAASKLGVSEIVLDELIKSRGISANSKVSSKVDSSVSNIENAIEQIKNHLNLDAKIKKELDSLLDNQMIRDAEFREYFDVSKEIWKSISSNPIFQDYRVNAGKFGIIWSSVAGANTVRDMLECNGVGIPKGEN